MTETLKTQQQLLASISDNQQQSNTAQSVRDIIYSVLQVGAGEVGGGADPVARNLELGRGLIPLSNRRFQVDVGGDGLYRFEAIAQADIDFEADVFVAVVKNDIQSGEGAPDFILKRTLKPGAKNEASNFIHIFEYHNVVEGDIIELEFKETGGSNVSNVDYVFTGHRQG